MRLQEATRHPATVSFATSGAIQLLNALTGVLLARSLGPAGRGELAAILLWPSVLAAVGSLGLSEAVTYETASGSSPVRTVVGASLTLAAAQSLALIVIGVAVVPMVHDRQDVELIRSTYLFLAFIPFNLLALYAIGVINGLRQYSTYHGLRFLVIGFMAGALVLLAAGRELTVQTAVAAYLTANAVTAFAAIAVLWRQRLLAFGHSRETVGRLLHFGLRTHMSNVTVLLNERLDQLLISVLLAPAKLGLYVVAVTLTAATTLVGQATSMVVLPLVASLKDPAERLTAAVRYVSWVLIGSVCIALPMMLFTPLLIRVLFGAGFVGVTNAARVLLVASVFLSTNRVLGAVLKAVGRPLDAGTAEFLSLGITLAGLALLLQRTQLLGAAVTSLLAYGAATVWLTAKTARALDVRKAALLFPAVGGGGPRGR